MYFLKCGFCQLKNTFLKIIALITTKCTAIQNVHNAIGNQKNPCVSKDVHLLPNFITKMIDSDYRYGGLNKIKKNVNLR